ncbi:related to sulfate permease SutB [Rhynchosporium graminicola]|uniref:Related to sulfate permease SutB n=1 Tax=Rhynchosporium graminicola TaxID=2792576 RepID=A0A1E1KCP1_9HELO|nr:related to sulfate permease SutB [Rhynchosporium commune]
MANFKIGEKLTTLKTVVRTDTTANRVRDFVVKSAPRLTSATAHYLLDKVPIVSWLPRYHPSWLLTDAIAGLTIGVMLIPQGLAYAKIATIPIENGLYSSWIPAAIYVFMGTSKDLSIGPTSILGLLTAEIIVDLKDEYDVVKIANAVSLMVGVYSLAMGVLGLGFLLDYISVPVLTGFISATALIIGFGQVGSLVGLSDVPTGVFEVIGDGLKRLPDWDGPTCGIGIGTIIILLALEKVGKMWGNKHYVIKYIASSRAVIVLVIFTLISYFVNKDRKDDLLWGVSKVDTHGIVAPTAHDTGLISKVATRAIAPLVACTLEHLAVGKAFGRKNGYTIDQSQELNYLGVANLANSFFGAMPVGGAMSRTAVNSECHVRSPLGGIVTAAFILLTLYVFSPALYWLPKSTLSAIIIMAVLHLFGPISAFYRYWRISLADFIASMLSFWVTIFVSAEIGIGCAAAWSVAWTMIRSAFVTPDVHANMEDEAFALPRRTSSFETGRHDSRTEHSGLLIPNDTVIIKFDDAIFYPNANRGKRSALEAIQLVYEKVSHGIVRNRERSWSVAAEKLVERRRKQQNITLRDVPLSIVIWDFTAVPFVDVTAILALGELKEDIRLHSGKDLQLRFVGISKTVRERFLRAEWMLTDLEGWRKDGSDVVYPSMERAVLHREGSEGLVLEAVTIGNEKTK